MALLFNVIVVLMVWVGDGGEMAGDWKRRGEERREEREGEEREGEGEERVREGETMRNYI